MDRRSLKQVRALIQSAKTPITGTRVSTEALQAQARAELSAVSDAYSTASLAADLIRSQLSRAESPKDIATLTRALKDVMSVLTEARQEARDTVRDLNSAPNESSNPPDSPTPPTPPSDGVLGGIAHSEILPDSDER